MLHESNVVQSEIPNSSLDQDMNSILGAFERRNTAFAGHREDNVMDLLRHVLSKCINRTYWIDHEFVVM